MLCRLVIRALEMSKARGSLGAKCHLYH